MAAPRNMVTVAEARLRAQKAVEREQRQWAATGGEAVRLEIVLHPPTERSAQADLQAAIEWTRSWRDLADGTAAAGVSWTERNWPSVGRQRVPERLLLVGADAIAAFAGTTVARGWHTLRDRSGRLRIAFPPANPVDLVAAAIRTHARTLETLGEPDFETLIDVVGWLADNPASGWRIRQLPIRGIDTKWLERHRFVVEGLYSAVTGRDSLGLLAPPPLVRVRFLDPVLRPGGLCDVTAPVEDLAVLPVAPSTVFVFENLETVLAMPDVPGSVVLHGGGYAARRLDSIPWVRNGRVIYWGDLDSDGFAILHALRSGCANVTSVLMDSVTLFAYRDLWVPETKPAVGVYPRLTPDELQVLESIRAEGNIRLEQERIGWEFALGRLLEAADLPHELSNAGSC